MLAHVRTPLHTSITVSYFSYFSDLIEATPSPFLQSMENNGQIYNPQFSFWNMSEPEHETANNNQERQTSNLIPPSQHSQIPVFMAPNNQTRQEPPIMIPGIANLHQTQLPPHTTPVLPDPNPQPGLDVGNTYFNNHNFTLNIPSAISDPQNTLFNMGTSVPNEANAGNEAPPTRRGRPLGSRNRPKVRVYPNEELSNPLVVLEFPPNCEIISWLLRYAQGRNISLAVVSGCGSVSEVVFAPAQSQQLSRAYRDGIMAMLSMSGTYINSPTEPSPSHSFFNVKVARNREEITGGALKIVTSGHVVLKVSFYPQNPVI